MTLVAPSTWMADCARASTIFGGNRIEVISNGLDTLRFQPTDRQEARAQLGLPSKKKLVLFAVASGFHLSHKGFDLLEAGLDSLQGPRTFWENVELVLVGPASRVGFAQSSTVRTISLGSVTDETKMAMLYSAVDATVVPSRQENLPQVAIESLACGTPVVAFRTTGLPEVVDHQQNGYLAPPFDPEALAVGLQWILEDEERYLHLCWAARSKALLSYDVNAQAKRYHRLFDELLVGSTARTA